MIDKTLIEELKLSMEEVFSKHNIAVNFTKLDIQLEQTTFTPLMSKYTDTGIVRGFGSGTTIEKMTICVDCYKNY